MSSEQNNNFPTTTVQGIEPTQQGTPLSAGTVNELPALHAAVEKLYQGFKEGDSGIPAQEDRGDPTVPYTGDDDDEYNSDDSEDSPPPSMSSSMLERGKGNEVKVGVRTTSTGEEVKKDVK
ncbi:hypothetical protein FA13DRAFT_1737198 [Coprinellus micaceus]|uniref:Uncharacterized protein n=1 Tax=Coprinellus micaceus TaxID=71717 RepID=A0A4Y7SXF4_COPMI|nr:hypothetical protein FA13DRAFT_1737198 [Coprinellus micaceus]